MKTNLSDTQRGEQMAQDSVSVERGCALCPNPKTRQDTESQHPIKKGAFTEHQDFIP